MLLVPYTFFSCHAEHFSKPSSAIKITCTTLHLLRDVLRFSALLLFFASARPVTPTTTFRRVTSTTLQFHLKTLQPGFNELTVII